MSTAALSGFEHLSRSLVSALRGRGVAVALVAVVLAILVLPPVIFLIHASFYPRAIDGSVGAATLQYYQRMMSRPSFVSSLVNTVIYALGSAVVAITVGAFQAWIVERTDTPFRALTRVFAITSLGIPNILYTVAWLLLLGKVGPINQLLMALLSSDSPVISANSLPAMILIEGLIWTPLAFLMFCAVFRNVDPSFEEAALASGAGILATLYRITLKLAFPAFAALSLLVFCRAVESFEVPFLVGGPAGIHVLATEVYMAVKSRIPADYGEASAFSVVLLVFVGLVLMLYRRISKLADRYQTITGKGYRPRNMRLGRWRYFTAALLLANFSLIIVLPLGIIVWASLVPYYTPPSVANLKLFTLENFATVLNSPTYQDAIGNTLLMASATATLTVVLTGLAGWMVARKRPNASILDQLSTVPLIFPNIVLGLAIAMLYLRVPLPIYGTLFILIIGYTTRGLPYGMRYAHTGALQIHKELEEAGSVSGAGDASTFRRIVAPLMTPALAAAWLYVFLTASRELSMALMLVGPNSMVVSVEIFDLWVGAGVVELAAVGLTWMVLMMAIAIIFSWLSRRYGISG